METHYTCTNTSGKPSKRPVPALLPLAKNKDSEEVGKNMYQVQEIQCLLFMITRCHSQE